MVVDAPTQDMPPKGGYGPISFKRVPARKVFKAWHLFAGVFASSVYGFYTWYNIRLTRKYEEIENRSSRFAIMPLLMAERDRGTLKMLWKNRIEEAELMKNVPNWEVGKFYDEPVFKTVPKDAWINPIATDYFVHSDYNDYKERVFFRLSHF